MQRLCGTGGLDLRPGLQVADLGCGWGYLGHLLLPSIAPGGRIDGFDLDDDALALGRSRARQVGARGLRFEPGAAASLDVDDDRYDRAVCQTLLIHQGDPLRVLQEMVRIVRPGGLVGVIEPDAALADAGIDDGIETDAQNRDRRAVAAVLRSGAQAVGAGDHGLGARLPELFADAGLQDVRVWLNPTVLRCIPGEHGSAEVWRRVLLRRTEARAFAERWKADHALFVAGGGDPALWERARLGADALRRERRRRLLDGTWAARQSLGLMVCVGRVG